MLVRADCSWVGVPAAEPEDMRHSDFRPGKSMLPAGHGCELLAVGREMVSGANRSRAGMQGAAAGDRHHASLFDLAPNRLRYGCEAHRGVWSSVQRHLRQHWREDCRKLSAVCGGFQSQLQLRWRAGCSTRRQALSWCSTWGVGPSTCPCWRALRAFWRSWQPLETPAWAGMTLMLQSPDMLFISVV